MHFPAAQSPVTPSDEADDVERRRELFLSLQTPLDVAKALGVELRALNFLLYSGEGTRYTRFAVMKRSGGTRDISVPVPALRRLQRNLCKLLEAVYKPRACVHGFVKSKGILTNAAVHAGATDVLNVDLQDFFPSIHFGRVRGILMAKPYQRNPKVATVLAQVAFCGSEGLPQGSPASPIISNILASDLDSAIFSIIRRRDVSYTRYADDLTFSTTSPKGLPHVIVDSASGFLSRELEALIRSKGFQINPAKLSRKRIRERREVTGLVVNVRPNVPRQRVRQIRGMLHAWHRFGEAAAEKDFLERWDNNAARKGKRLPGCFRRVLAGRLSYLAMIRGKEDALYQQLVRRARQHDLEFFLRSPIPDDALWVTFSDLNDPATSPNDTRQGTAFETDRYGLVSCAHTVTGPTNLVLRDENSPIDRIRVLNSSSSCDVSLLDCNRHTRYRFRVCPRRTVKVSDPVTIGGFAKWQTGGDVRWVSTHVAEIRKYTKPYAIYSLADAVVEGMSGGPVLNSAGEVIGILLTTEANQHPNSFISIDSLQQLQTQLVQSP